MATLHNEVLIHVSPTEAWAAAEDVGALHTRLVPGFVVDTRLEGEVRVVTFGNGMVVREPIISVDSTRRRLAWCSEGAGATHYNAVLQMFPEGSGTRVTWTTDLLPHALADRIQALQEQALAVMKRTLEAASVLPG